MKLALAIAMLVACSAPHDGVVLWHSYTGDERTALESTAAAWNASHPDAELTLVAVPHGAFADKLSSAIPRGNGPDLFIYAQDRIGDWAAAGVIEPIEFWVDDAIADRFRDDAFTGLAYRDSMWGLPLAMKSLALYYRTDIVAHPPRTTADLLALAKRLHAQHTFALAYANVDLYGHAAWLHGFGGRVMSEDGTLAIATPAAEQAMLFAKQLVDVGAVPADAQAPLVSSLFNEGKAAMAMSGPWFRNEIQDGVPWAVTTLPIVTATGAYAAPFASSEGVLMSARAHDKQAAFAVMDFLTNDASAITRAKLGHQVVANLKAFDDAGVAADATVGAFRAQLEHVVSLPKVPAMRMVWTPYRAALGEVLAGRAEPGPKLLDVENEIRGYVKKAAP